MSKFRKKPVVIEAVQWFRNGDHPEDYATSRAGFEGGLMRMWTGEEAKVKGWEGAVVRYFNHPNHPSDGLCGYCGATLHAHGWVDTAEGGHVVCPGDWIITGVKGERYPCKPDIFEQTYEPVE